MSKISEKAEFAVIELNRASLLMHRQIRASVPDLAAADKAVKRAKRKINDWRTAYFIRAYRPDHLSDLQDFDRSELKTKLEKAHERFNRRLKAYIEYSEFEFAF